MNVLLNNDNQSYLVAWPLGLMKQVEEPLIKYYIENMGPPTYNVYRKRDLRENFRMEKTTFSNFKK